MLLLVIFANLGMVTMIDSAVRDASEREVANWVVGMPPATVDRLLESGDESLGSALSDLLRPDMPQSVTVFDLAGTPVNRFGIGQTGSAPIELPVADPLVLEVARTGQTRTELVDGAEGSGARSRLADVYIPARAANGEIEAVLKVQLDRTLILKSLYGAAIALGVTLSVTFTLVMTGLYAAFVRKRRAERRVRERAEYLAKYDQLSGVLNRTGVSDQLENAPFELADAAILYVDIDHFKNINDTHGHKAGDAFVRHVGAVLRASCARDSIIGRLGGDEFIAIVRCTDVAAAVALADEVQARVAQPIHSEGKMISTSVSIGIAYGGSAEMTFDERAHRADLALYQAKLDGRSTHCVFTDELERRIQRRRCVESSLVSGLEAGLFDVYFQPLIDGASLACVGFEALLRLTGKDGEPVAPAEFVPIAESIGVIGQLGAWVLERAVETAASWPAPLFVAVNLSPRQFDGGDLTGIVRGALERTGLTASRLELEVTESLLLDNTERVGQQLAELRALGVSVAMDDFGTGHSGLGTLWRFGFDKLKIDRSFVVSLESGGDRARNILDTIIALGHRLNMVVTAEGIETPAQARILSELACDQLQGYLFGRPMPAEQLPRDLFQPRRLHRQPELPVLRDGTNG